MEEKLICVPTAQTTGCCPGSLLASEVPVLGCGMQSSASLSSSPDGVAISSRETQQLAGGNRVSSFLHCCEKEYRWQHKALWTAVYRAFGQLNATLRVTAKFLQPWESEKLLSTRVIFTREDHLNSNNVRMSGFSSQTSLQILQKNTEQKPQCLMTIFRGPVLVNSGLPVNNSF